MKSSHKLRNWTTFGENPRIAVKYHNSDIGVWSKGPEFQCRLRNDEGSDGRCGIYTDPWVHFRWWARSAHCSGWMITLSGTFLYPTYYIDWVITVNVLCNHCRDRGVLETNVRLTFCNGALVPMDSGVLSCYNRFRPRPRVTEVKSYFHLTWPLRSSACTPCPASEFATRLTVKIFNAECNCLSRVVPRRNRCHPS
jgi:hypothetical protein